MEMYEWRDLIGAYCESLAARGYAQTTARSRARQLATFVRWGVCRGLASPGDYTLVQIEDYRLHLHHLIGKGGAPLGWGSKVQILLAIKGLFRWLTLTHRIPSNPAADVELPRRQHRLPRAVLSVAAVERVLAQPNLDSASGLRDRAILELLYSTGIRRAECAGLNLSDLDLDRSILMVRCGKGARDRYVPAGRRSVNWIERYLREARPLHVANPDDGHLFMSRRRSHLSPKRLGDLVRGYLIQAGIRPAGACHLLRHTTATLMLEGGADIRYIQEILGHAQLSTTAIYARVSIRRLQEVHRRCHPAG
jgi:integrase/recombinase XerD